MSAPSFFDADMPPMIVIPKDIRPEAVKEMAVLFPNLEKAVSDDASELLIVLACIGTVVLVLVLMAIVQPTRWIKRLRNNHKEVPVHEGMEMGGQSALHSDSEMGNNEEEGIELHEIALQD